MHAFYQTEPAATVDVSSILRIDEVYIFVSMCPYTIVVSKIILLIVKRTNNATGVFHLFPYTWYRMRRVSSFISTILNKRNISPYIEMIRLALLILNIYKLKSTSMATR